MQKDVSSPDVSLYMHHYFSLGSVDNCFLFPPLEHTDIIFLVHFLVPVYKLLANSVKIREFPKHI